MTELTENLLSEYQIRASLSNSVEVQTVVLEQTKKTQRVLKTKIVRNLKNPSACLEVELIHERNSSENFDSPEAPKLTNLRVGEWTSCSLNSEQTLKLFKELERQYVLASHEGVIKPYNTKKYVVCEIPHESHHLDSQDLIKVIHQCHYHPDFAKKLAEIQPELIDEAYCFRAMQKRREGLVLFQTMLKGQLSEEDWQNFFSKHDWVLGGIFDVQILGKTISQPHLKGANIDGRGFKRGDFLLNTMGHSKFSAIAEIKKPETELQLSPIEVMMHIL